MPLVRLNNFDGDPVHLEHIAFGWVVYYFYPGTGIPPAEDREGPREDTAQHRAFRGHRDDFEVRKVRVVGVSSQSMRAQRKAVIANLVCHEMLTDPELVLAEQLGLPTFEMGGARWYRRLTLLTRDRQITRVFCPVESARRNPSQVIAWMQLQGS
jgi:peroxiredoxin